MSTRTSHRVPWPWDARIATTPPPSPALVIGDLRTHTIGSSRGTLIGAMRGHARPFGLSQGFMLLPQPDTSLLVARKQTHLENLYPATAEYDSAPVYRERTFQFRPTGGIGESVQSGSGDRRYHYGINVWVTGGLFGKGPLVHAVVPAGTPVAMVRRFAEARRGLVDALFYLTKEAVYVRNDDTNAGQARLHERAGHQPLDMARFMGAYAGTQDCLYVTWEDGTLEERKPDDSFVSAALPAGFGAHFLEVVGDELWAADKNRSIVRKCTDDPKVAGSWSGPILVGTPSVPITALRQSSNRLAIFKADGSVFTINADGTDNDLFPGLRTSQDTDNGRTATAWLSSIWFRSGRAWYELDLAQGATLTPRGPGRNLGNLSEVRGPVQVLAGWNSQMAFCAIYNEENGASYLLSYGSWVPSADPDSGASGRQNITVSGTEYTFVAQYDGALKKWAGRKVTAMFVSNVPTEARLYCGFSDGNYDWIKLVPYPLLQGGGSEYTLDESFIVLPLHHAVFQSDNKHWTGASIFGLPFDPGNSVKLSYRVTGSAVGTGSTPTGAFLEWGPLLDRNGMRSNPVPQIAGKGLELRIDLNNVDPTQTPVLEGLGLHERLVPAFRRDFLLTVNANEYVTRRDGASARQSGVTIRKWLEEAASSPISISLELPDEVLNEVALFSYDEHMTPHARHGGQSFAINVQATQFKVLTRYGSIGRTRGTLIGDTRGYTVAQMRFF
jgi:hypothetical protein